MTITEHEQVLAELNRALAVDEPWVAFNDRPDQELRAQDLHFFAAAYKAEIFCDAGNNAFDFAAQMFTHEHHSYMPVANLLAALSSGTTGATGPGEHTTAIIRQMTREKLYLLPGRSYDDAEASLTKGLFFPVTRQLVIDPLKEIDDYHVIKHQHSGGQIYEIGHSHQVLESFSRLREARDFMDNAVLYNELADRGNDYLLVGRFHNRRLELDMEGYALAHSGLTLVTANYNFQHGHDYHDIQSVSEPATITQYFFARLQQGKLGLYNDKLEPADPDLLQRTFYPTYFINDYLTIKNSNNMNEQSYDYVKNQLLYLGFGEEIAKPLLEKMEQNLAEFTLPHSRKFGQDETSSVLHFSKGDQKDMTFFNRFETTLKQPGKEDLTQTFFVGKEYNYTLQERYNMMDGRAAYREQPVMRPVEENGETKMKPTGETYIAWKILNFKESDNYGNFMPKTLFWNHQKEVEKYPIKGIDEKYDRQRLITALEKGNKVDVVVLKDGREIPAKMVANPRMVRLDFYDSDGQSLIVRKLQKQALDETQKTGMTPQEIQRAAIARAAEQQPAPAANRQTQNGIEQEQTPATKPQDTAQSSTAQHAQKETAKERLAADQKPEQRRRQGVRPN
ncbi:hypothetical protein [Mucilaginibacter aquaedulcis]|uniref:hypothetical protein n=1 Tax=Mucilaginibacter aquaedulcis TaxID=1187081 RepID=UPI0025B282A7|nr:hypothetical protein [Mucilaginibacter aquaedulcis]MDN3548977.1 hypothetical protein [Mucilaginibacter aquaedulcis]